MRRWEIALALAVLAALVQGTLFPESVTLNWWSVMFPGLSEGLGEGWQETSAAGGGVEVRLWIVEAFRALFTAR